VSPTDCYTSYGLKSVMSTIIINGSFNWRSGAAHSNPWFMVPDDLADMGYSSSKISFIYTSYSMMNSHDTCLDRNETCKASPPTLFREFNEQP
jgi:hypothetical protein